MTDGVVLKARSDNTAFIELATSATPALGDIARLDAGEAVVMPIMSVDKVWVRSSVVGAALDIFGASAY